MAVVTKSAFEFKGKFVKPKVPLALPGELDYKKLWPHQRRFLEELKHESYWFVVGPPAAGKSLTIAALLQEKLTENPKLRAIITVPQTIIGNGFEDCRFILGRNDYTFFDPIIKLHYPNEDSNHKVLKRFLKSKPTSPVNDRVAICTHQSLVQAYKKFPKLFKDVLVVIDEAHHSQADQAEEETITNCLGATVVDLVARGQQVGLATATASRGDGYGLLGPHQDKFKVSECPFDEYLKVCRWFESFTFDFVLYDKDISEPVDQLLGDKRKMPPRTLIHIPHVNSTASSGKLQDLRKVYCGIAGHSKPQIRNRNGRGNGVTEVKRGSRWIKVVDLVNEQNRQIKKGAIAEAHDAPDSDKIDCIIALNMFREGANWRWAEKSFIIGYRGSFTELTQMVGRGLRDAPEKYRSAIHYLLPRRGQDITGAHEESLNDYLKALLFGLLLEDVFQPVEIRAKKKRSKKRQVIKVDLLGEAVGFSTAEKLRIEREVVLELLQFDKVGKKAAIKAIQKVLKNEGVKHPSVTLEVIAKQLYKTHQRRAQHVLSHLLSDVKRMKARGVGEDLLESNHPLNYLQYYTEALGAGTLASLREALQDHNEKRWWYMYDLLVEFVDKFDRFPTAIEVYKKETLGAWLQMQKHKYKNPDSYHFRSLSDNKIRVLELLPGWLWDNLIMHRWWYRYDLLVEFVDKFGRVPYIYEVYNDEALGQWVYKQREKHRGRNTARTGRLSSVQLNALQKLDCWTWEPITEWWNRLFGQLYTHVAKYNRYPSFYIGGQQRTLVTWMWRQKERYHKGTLSSEKVQKLESIPDWVWRDDRWENKFCELIEFINRVGILPQYASSGTEKDLYRWTSDQRKLYKKGKLTKDQIKKLESIPDWWWDRSHVWYEHLYTYIDTTKNLGRPPSLGISSNEEEYKSASWAAHQRANYKKGKLTKDRIEKLESIPGWWWTKEEKK